MDRPDQEAPEEPWISTEDVLNNLMDLLMRLQTPWLEGDESNDEARAALCEYLHNMVELAQRSLRIQQASGRQRFFHQRPHVQHEQQVQQQQHVSQGGQDSQSQHFLEQLPIQQRLQQQRTQFQQQNEQRQQQQMEMQTDLRPTANGGPASLQEHQH